MALQPPPPWATPSRIMTSIAAGISYEQFISAGWADSTLVEYGYMEKPMMSAAPPVPSLSEPSRSLDKIHKDLLARTEQARTANDAAANARDLLREVRDEYQAAFSYYVNEAHRQITQ